MSQAMLRSAGHDERQVRPAARAQRQRLAGGEVAVVGLHGAERPARHRLPEDVAPGRVGELLALGDRDPRGRAVAAVPAAPARTPTAPTRGGAGCPTAAPRRPPPRPPRGLVDAPEHLQREHRGQHRAGRSAAPGRSRARAPGRAGRARSRPRSGPGTSPPRPGTRARRAARPARARRASPIAAIAAVERPLGLLAAPLGGAHQAQQRGADAVSAAVGVRERLPAAQRALVSRSSP